MMLRSQKYNNEPRQCACYVAYSWLERQEMVSDDLTDTHEIVIEEGREGKNGFVPKELIIKGADQEGGQGRSCWHLNFGMLKVWTGVHRDEGEGQVL